MIDGHSYVSIKQYILYILGCGKMPQKISVNRYSKIQDISDSRIYKEVQHRATRANPNVQKRI